MCHGKCWNWRCDPGQGHGKKSNVNKHVRLFAYGKNENIKLEYVPITMLALRALTCICRICTCIGDMFFFRWWNCNLGKKFLAGTDAPEVRPPLTPTWDGGRIDLSTNMYSLGSSVSRFEFIVYRVYSIMGLDQRCFAKNSGFLTTSQMDVCFLQKNCEVP